MKTTLDTILTALTLQKKQIEGQLYPLKDSILKKKNAIATLGRYADEYKKQCDHTALHRVSSYQNQQHFLDKLFGVLYSEKQELAHLETRQADILRDYHTLNKKIDGIQDILIQKKNTARITEENTEDAKRSEFATIRSCLQQMENNE